MEIPCGLETEVGVASGYQGMGDFIPFKHSITADEKVIIHWVTIARQMIEFSPRPYLSVILM
jgi:hypothetical protein